MSWTLQICSTNYVAYPYDPESAPYKKTTSQPVNRESLVRSMDSKPGPSGTLILGMFVFGEAARIAGLIDELSAIRILRLPAYSNGGKEGPG